MSKRKAKRQPKRQPKAKPQPQPIDAAHVRQAFQRTAECVGGDILRCCEEAGEKPVIPRDVLFDYIALYGGEHGKEVSQFVMSHPGTLEELERDLDRMEVPRTWS